MDIKDIPCNQTELCHSSSESSISGLSGYEEELKEIRNLLKSGLSPLKLKQADQSLEAYVYESRISQLNSKLQNALKLNEQYRNEILTTSRSNELKQHEKFEELARRNAELKAQLDKANSFIKSRNCESDESKYELQCRIGILENELVEKGLKYQQICADCDVLQKNLNTAAFEAKLRENCIDELKEKISNKHTEVLHNIHENVILNNKIISFQNEVSHLKKSLEWYKENLHKYQNEKNKLIENVLQIKAQIIDKNSSIDILQAAIEDWKEKYREVENSLNKFTGVLKVVPENNIPQEKAVLNDCIEPVNDININQYEHEIKLLTDEVLKIQKSYAKQKELFEKLTEDNSALLTRNITLQKLVNNKEIEMEIFQNRILELTENFNKVSQDVNIKSNEILNITSENTKLKVSLATVQHNYDEISLNVISLRNDFEKFSKLYKDTKIELNEKNKMVLELQQGKQELFMSNNWNKCEIDSFKQKEKEYSNKINYLEAGKLELSKDLLHLKTLNSTHKNHVEQLNKQLTAAKEQLNDNVDWKSKYENLEIDFKCLKETVKINNMDTVEELNKKISDFKSSLNNVFSHIIKKVRNITENNFDGIITLKSVYMNNNDDKNDFLVDSICNLDVALTELANYFKPQLKFRKGMMDKMNELETRCDFLNDKVKKTESEFEKIKNFSGSGTKEYSDEINKLRLLLKVKDDDFKEKFKRYETNNRTLLRKVKEHMRGRNRAEKHRDYIQSVYDTASENLNTLKLEVDRKDFEIAQQQHSIETKNKAIFKLKSSLANLEQKLVEVNNCGKFSDLDGEVAVFRDEYERCKGDLKGKEVLVASLKHQVSLLVNENEALKFAESKWAADLENCENETNRLNEKFNHSSAQLEKLKSDHQSLLLQHSNDAGHLNQTLAEHQHLQDTSDYYSKEIKTLNCNLQQKDEEIQTLDAALTKLRQDLTEEVSKYKDAKVEIDQLDRLLKSTTNEKFYLQRLSSDLKVALNSLTQQNQSLQERIHNRSNDLNYHSLPELASSLSSLKSIDKIHITQLLQKTNKLVRQKPLSNLHDCLNSLKREMANLQQQVAEKQIVASSL